MLCSLHACVRCGRLHCALFPVVPIACWSAFIWSSLPREHASNVVFVACMAQWMYVLAVNQKLGTYLLSLVFFSCNSCFLHKVRGRSIKRLMVVCTITIRRPRSPFGLSRRISQNSRVRSPPHTRILSVPLRLFVQDWSRVHSLWAEVSHVCKDACLTLSVWCVCVLFSIQPRQPPLMRQKKGPSKSSNWSTLFRCSFCLSFSL